MTWALASIALGVLLVAALSRLLTGTPITPPMVFVLFGIVVGPKVLDGLDPAARGGTVRTLAEATLAVVLFSDASRIKFSALRREYSVPVRLLGVGLPLTIALGALLAAAIFSELSLAEALVLAVVLAPTDAALGQAVVTDPRLPSRISQGLNVESGLNDGICVPLLYIALAAADVHAKVTTGHHALTIVAEQIGYGLLAGVLAGALVTVIVQHAKPRRLITGAWLQVIPVAGAALAYGVATGLDGSGFIAAFVAGGLFGGFAGEEADEASRLSVEVGDVLDGVTFIVFGAVLLGPALGHLSWEAAGYALLSLTLVRFVPVAIAMIGSRARLATVAFLGWFGPRGLASIVFAIIVVDDYELPHADTIALVIYATVGLSVLLHGLTAAPLAGAYARWYKGETPTMESVPSPVHRARGANVS
jgi:NhaP-type Na+/H+ or K+/H+ antiporter